MNIAIHLSFLVSVFCFLWILRSEIADHMKVPFLGFSGTDVLFSIVATTVTFPTTIH